MHPWMDPTRRPGSGRTNTARSMRPTTHLRLSGPWLVQPPKHALNLPFANDAEFGALHAAIRALLPILPALAASSPVIDGKPGGWLDNRLRVYRSNSAKIPSITGRVIPEAVFSRKTTIGRFYNACITTSHRTTPRESCRRVPELARCDCPVRPRQHRDSRAGYPGMSPSRPGNRSGHCAELASLGPGTVAEPRLLETARNRSARTHLPDDTELAETAQIDDHSYLESFGLRSAKPVCARDVCGICCQSVRLPRGLIVRASRICTPSLRTEHSLAVSSGDLMERLPPINCVRRLAAF